MAIRKNSNLKKANIEVEYTYEQVQELKKCASDPVYFIRSYVRIQHPKRGEIPFDLYDYQEDMVNAYNTFQYVITLSARQTGKAIHIDTPIATPNGWTTMEKIQPGDQVLDANGQPTNVTAISDIMHDHKCYKITFSNNETIIADAEHLWEVDSAPGWKHLTQNGNIKTTQQMVDEGATYCNTKGYEESKFNIKLTKPLDLVEQNLSIDPYTLGVWLGDGTQCNGSITTHIDDKEIIDKLSESSGLKTKSSEYKPNILTTIVYGLQTLLKENYVFRNKHIPQKYLRGSHEQRLSLLQGLMDTDGTVNPGGDCEIGLSNKTLAEHVYELLITLGLKPTIKEKKTTHKLSYNIGFTAYRSEHPIFKLTRKLEKMKNAPHPSRKYSTKKRSIRKIEEVDSVPVKCISVDNQDHLYLAGRGMIPTHNSETAAAFLLWYAMFNFNKTILIASRSNDHAMEMIMRIRFAYEQLPLWLKPGVEEDGWNKHNIGFDNKSRIMSAATSENTGRGFAISLLYLDEFAFVPQNIQEEFWASISPTLSTGGSCIMTSTPNGDMDIYAGLWRGANLPSADPNAKVGHNGFFPIRVLWDQPPDRDEKFKDDQIAKLGERKWMQEYECEFLSSEALLINSLVLANMTPRIQAMVPMTVIKDVMFWYEIKKGGTYLLGVDPATGTGEDYSVITLYEFPEMRQVAEYRSNTMSTNDLYTVLKNILLYMDKMNTMVYFSIENNGVGEGVISLYEADENPPDTCEFVSEEGKNKRGMTTTSKTKMKACVNLKEMIEKNNMEITSPVMLAELKAYVRTKGAYAAQPGSTDDCVSASLIVTRLIEEIATYDQVAFDKLYTGDFNEWGEDDWDGWDGGYSDDGDELPVLII